MNPQIYEEATDWLLELRTESADAGKRQRFDAWLCASPIHVRAYLELTALWEEIGAIDPARSTNVEDLLDRAEAVTNVVSLTSTARAPQRPTVPQPPGEIKSRQVRRYVPIAASFLVAAVIAAGAWIGSGQAVRYTTGIGERRSLLLSDGSAVELNARSRIRVRYRENERAIDLLEGQALFRVARDSTRPFIVHTGDTGIRAIGTQFDVHRRKSSTVVTVLEGKVAVVPAARSAEPNGPAAQSVANPERILLTAGQQLVVTSRAVSKAQPANVVAATAWTRHRLVFESTPLDEVAKEFNRYNLKQLIIRAEELEDFHISGAFSSSDPQPLLRFLRAQNGIHVEERPDQVIITRR